MAESLKKVYPGNWITHISAWPYPNADFKANKRGVGDPRDRQQQAILYMPGVCAIQKVGHVFIDTPLDAAATATVGYDVIIGSPDTRSADKPRADVKGLFVPEGSWLYRLGFRVCSVTDQPGFSTAGPKDPLVPARSGLFANPDAEMWLDSGNVTGVSGAPPAGIAAARSASGPLDVDVVSGEFMPSSVEVTLPVPVSTANDQTFKLYVSKGGMGTTFLGGIYLVVEACYMAPDSVPDLDTIHLPGARYSGFTS